MIAHQTIRVTFQCETTMCLFQTTSKIVCSTACCEKHSVCRYRGSSRGSKRPRILLAVVSPCAYNTTVYIKTWPLRSSLALPANGFLHRISPSLRHYPALQNDHTLVSVGLIPILQTPILYTTNPDSLTDSYTPDSSTRDNLITALLKASLSPPGFCGYNDSPPTNNLRLLYWLTYTYPKTTGRQSFKVVMVLRIHPFTWCIARERFPLGVRTSRW